MRFTGDYDQLQEKLSLLAGNGEWVDVNDNQKQFRHKSGGILNWYPSTGKLHFQGPVAARQPMEEMVEKLLDNEAVPSELVTNAFVTDSITESQSEDFNADFHPHISDFEREMLADSYSKSELVIGLVGAVGTELDTIKRIIRQRLETYGYSIEEVKVSKDIIAELEPVSSTSADINQYERISKYMRAGNALRERTKDSAVMALGVIAKISQKRERENSSPKPKLKRAVIIDSIKHPEEVHMFRQVYSSGFYLVSVFTDEKRRYDQLTQNHGMSHKETSELMARDADESVKHGQHTRDAFHIADFFVHQDSDSDKFQYDVWRILELMHGKPFVTPTFDEFAMFMAFSSALRSADLSRQVGAVVAQNKNIVATGANDIPKAGGGLYWPEYDDDKHQIVDAPDGRDYMRGEDSNTIEKQKIIDNIVSNAPEQLKESLQDYLTKSRIKDITEYGRVDHAEMEAILSCSRNQISTEGSHLYCTTYPCHNCAKHIIASGVKRVVYIEPYPKSKAMEFHSDAITTEKGKPDSVVFEPFVGVGPRAFVNLFSMELGSGYSLKRKDSSGKVVAWAEENSSLRVPLLPYSYLEREIVAAHLLGQYVEEMKNDEKES